MLVSKRTIREPKKAYIINEMFFFRTRIVSFGSWVAKRTFQGSKQNYANVSFWNLNSLICDHNSFFGEPDGFI